MENNFTTTLTGTLSGEINGSIDGQIEGLVTGSMGTVLKAEIKVISDSGEPLFGELTIRLEP